jgi:hypothetical protein
MLRLALAFCVLAASAEAAEMRFMGVYHANDRVLTREQSLLRHNGSINSFRPSYACDYTKGSLCGGETFYRRLASNWTYRNASNYITYAPNNLFTNSAVPTGSRIINTDGNGKYLLHCEGAGSISYIGTASGTLTCGGADRLLSPGAGPITLSVTPPVLRARFSEVMFETSLRAIDNFDNGSVAWQPARIDKNGWLIEGIEPDCCNGEGTTTYPAVSNLLLYSNALSGAYYAPASASTTVAAAPGVISPDGTADAWLITNVNNVNDGLAVASPVTAAPGRGYAFSKFMRRETAVWVMLDLLDTTGPTNRRAWFNLQTGATGTACGDCVVSMEPDPSGNGWFRLSIGVANVENVAATFKPTMKLVAGDNTTTGCVCSAYSYGWQLDNHGAGAFSYSPTNGYAAARAPETAMSTDARLTAAMAFVVETGSRPQGQAGATTAPIFLFNSGPSIASECGTDIYCGVTTLVKTGVMVSSGALTTTYANATTTNTSTWGGRNRFAYMMDANAASISLNGGPVATAPLLSQPLARANIWLDLLGGYVRSISAYASILPFPVMQEKSKVGAAL